MHPDITELCNRITAVIADQEADSALRQFTTVAIGGHGGSGKSSLAGVLADQIPQVQIVGTDSFWNGSMFDLDRLRREVLDVLLAGETATFNEWDWHAKKANLARQVTPSGVIVVEGVCALHQIFRNDLDVRVWVDAPHDIRLQRGVDRDGEAMRSTWLDVWMPNEAAYVQRDQPIACAHMVIDGTIPYR